MNILSDPLIKSEGMLVKGIGTVAVTKSFDNTFKKLRRHG